MRHPHCRDNGTVHDECRFAHFLAGRTGPGEWVSTQLINITNLGRPALLIFFLWSLHRAESAEQAQGMAQIFALWQAPQAALGGMIGAGIGIGMAVNQPLLGLVGCLSGGLVLGWTTCRRSEAEELVLV